VQESVSLTLTELPEAREAAVEVKVISRLRQRSGGLGGGHNCTQSILQGNTGLESPPGDS